MIEVPASVARVTIDGTVVAKKYKRERYAEYGISLPAEALFHNEVAALHAVKGRPGCQQLIKCAPDSLTIFSENAGLAHGASPETILDSLERAGVAHRDIHPKNLIRGRDGWTLIDFQWACLGIPEHLESIDRDAMDAAISELG